MNKNFRIALQYDPDGYWIAEHPELPGCKADGETPEEALISLGISRKLWIESRLTNGLEVPEPQEVTQYSGRFVLRIAKSMHRELTQEAEAEGVSLNSFIGQVLAARHAQKGERVSFAHPAPFGCSENKLPGFHMQSPDSNKPNTGIVVSMSAGQSTQKEIYQRMTFEVDRCSEQVRQYA